MGAKKSKKVKSKRKPNPVVEIKGLTVRYDRVVLHKISWKIEKGEQWVLLGSNGSGKTTLLKLVVKKFLEKNLDYYRIVGEEIMKKIITYAD